MSRYLRLLLPAYLFTWPVFITTYAWALLVHFLDSINNDSGDIAKRVVIITTLHLMLYVILFVAKRSYLDRIKPAYVPTLLFISLSAAAIFRGFVMEQWLFTWNITDSLDLGLRMRTSLLNSATSISIAIIAAANTRRHHMTKALLLNETARLENIKENSLESIKKLNNNAVTSIKTELTFHLNSMQGKSALEILNILKTMIDKVVQPLSRRLDLEFKPWSPPEVRQSEIRIDWYQAFRTSLNPKSIRYGLVPLLMTVVALPTVLKYSELVVAISGLCFSFITGYLVGRFLQRLFKADSATIFSYFIVTILTGFAMGLSTIPLTKNYESPFGLLILGTILYPFTASIISLLTGADEQLAKSSLELEAMTEELEWNVARIRESQYRSQRTLARNLHGSVQAKLASRYLELEQLNNIGAVSDSKIQETVAAIQQTIDSISIEPELPNDLKSVIQKIQENWAAIAEIQLDISAQDLERIQKDPLCMATLLDVIPELVFNGIKHGAATRITIAIRFKSDRVIRLTVVDNGKNQLQGSKIGLGTKILNESSMAWNRERENNSTLTSADFAFSLNADI